MKWYSIVWALLPKKAIARLIIDGLIYLANKTENTIDNEVIANAEKWLIEKGFLEKKITKKD